MEKSPTTKLLFPLHNDQDVKEPFVCRDLVNYEAIVSQNLDIADAG